MKKMKDGEDVEEYSFDDGNKESDEMLTMMKVRMRVKRKTSRV